MLMGCHGEGLFLFFWKALVECPATPDNTERATESDKRIIGNGFNWDASPNRT